MKREVVQGKRTRNADKPKKGIHEVAALAGVSISTVSRVTNGAPNVDPKLSRKVWRAVAETEYVPNRHAQALISGRTRLLGLLVSEIVNPFFPELIHGFESAAKAEGFGILIGSTDAEPARAEHWVQRMLQHGIEGLALLTFASEPSSVFEHLKNTPVIRISVGRSIEGVDEVDVDYSIGMRQAVQHLAALGHRDIVFAAGPFDEPTSSSREKCFRTAMGEIGVTGGADLVFHEAHTLEGGIAAAGRILKRGVLPTGLICSNDLMAIGAMKVFHSVHVQVPQEISVIGLDDIHLAEFITPPLTTIRIPRMQLAQVCFDVLLQRLRPQEGQTRIRPVVPTSLVVRQSTNYPRQAPQSAKTRKGTR